EIVQILSDIDRLASRGAGDLRCKGIAVRGTRKVEQQELRTVRSKSARLSTAKRAERAGEEHGLAGEGCHHRSSCTSSIEVSPTGLSKAISPLTMTTIRSQDWKTWCMLWLMKMPVTFCSLSPRMKRRTLLVSLTDR